MLIHLLFRYEQFHYLKTGSRNHKCCFIQGVSDDPLCFFCFQLLSNELFFFLFLFVALSLPLRYLKMFEVCLQFQRNTNTKVYSFSCTSYARWSLGFLWVGKCKTLNFRDFALKFEVIYLFISNMKHGMCFKLRSHRTNG